MSDNRLADIKLFYEILTQIEHSNGGGRLLSHCTGRMDWPLRGIYFIREPQEVRRETGEGSRIVRIRTHPTRPGSKTKLWGYLANTEEMPKMEEATIGVLYSGYASGQR